MVTTLFHGSNVAVEKPRLIGEQRNLDFGNGFYTTTNQTQAIDFAKKVMVRENTPKCFVSSYQFDLAASRKNLSVREFTEPSEAWLNFVLANRNNTYIGENYDLVVGPVANDQVYKVLIAFEAGIYDTKDALKRLKIQSLYNQFVFKSDKSLSLLQFTNVITV